MATVVHPRATLDDLYRAEGKAELIGGRIVPLMATGDMPNQIAANIFVSLREYAKKSGKGVAYTDNMGFAISELPSGRESFSPDASYYLGPRPKNRMRFISGPPTLAVEVRSENDYSQAAENEIAAKRQDYFLAGTLVVWDVDTKAKKIHVYRHPQPDKKTTFRPGQTAEAEEAVPGWRISVDEVFQTS
jgi:Uma2 family endonuclease